VSQVAGGPTEAEPLDAIPVDERDNRAAVALVSWILLLVVLVTAGWWVGTKVLFPDGGSVVARYANSDAGKWYESAGDQFRAVFPTEPTREARQDPDGRTVTVVSRPGSGYRFSVTRQPEPSSAIESYETTLNQLAGTLASDAGAEIVSQGKAQRVPGMDAVQKEIVFRNGDERHHVWLILGSDRVYVLDATTPGTDEKAALRFRLGFTKLGS
jgi:hypothetical protein